MRQIRERSAPGAPLPNGGGGGTVPARRILGLVVSRGFSLEDGGISQLHRRKEASNCACASSPSTRHLAAELVRVLAPSLGGGKSRSRWRRCAEWLRQRRRRLLFRSSSLQKVVGFYPAAKEGVRLAEEEFSLQSYGRPFLLRVADLQTTRHKDSPVSWRKMRT